MNKEYYHETVDLYVRKLNGSILDFITSEKPDFESLRSGRWKYHARVAWGDYREYKTLRGALKRAREVGKTFIDWQCDTNDNGIHRWDSDWEEEKYYSGEIAHTSNYYPED